MPPEEKLRLVTDWGELRTGMIVVVKPCARCGQRHRHVLLSAGTAGGLTAWRAFEVTPAPSCFRGRTPGLCEDAIPRRNVFIVVDGLDIQRDTRELVEDIHGAQVRDVKRRAGKVR